MRSQFRFPKATTVLMVIILAGVVLAIEKAKAINASLPGVNPQLGPIEPAHFNFFPMIGLMFVFFYAAGVLGWGSIRLAPFRCLPPVGRASGHGAKVNSFRDYLKT